ncbi:MAG: SCO family protein [Azoarcus sp.]|nr:SCO family protein [Azoarcus sp.]
MAEAVERLGTDGTRVQGLFATLDPERDTPDVLSAYTTAFHEDFLGLYGTPEEIAGTAADFRTFHEKRAADHANQYTIDHMAAIYVFDADGFLRLYMKGDTQAEVIAHDLQILLDS